MGDFELAAGGEIDTGRVTAIFGPSGSGKSTLLRAFAGLERGATGRLSLGREVWLDSARGLRHIGPVARRVRFWRHGGTGRDRRTGRVELNGR